MVVEVVGFAVVVVEPAFAVVEPSVEVAAAVELVLASASELGVPSLNGTGLAPG